MDFYSVASARPFVHGQISSRRSFNNKVIVMQFTLVIAIHHTVRSFVNLMQLV